MDKLIIEVRVNEYAPRDRNRMIPFSAEELGRDAQAVHNAGASIIHFHPRQPDGAPAHDIADYAAAIRAIRQHAGVLINPTLGQITVGGSARDRLRPIEALAGNGALRPELCGIDPGSTNIDVYDHATQRFRSGDRVYANSHETLQYFCSSLRELGIKPALACWSVPFVRSACALIDMGLIDDPPYFFFVCGEGGTFVAGGDIEEFPAFRFEATTLAVVEANGRLLLEVHLFDFSEQVYGRMVSVEFMSRLREERHYDSLDLLTAQIQRDAEAARAWHAAHPLQAQDLPRD